MSVRVGAFGSRRSCRASRPSNRAGARCCLARPPSSTCRCRRRRCRDRDGERRGAAHRDTTSRLGGNIDPRQVAELPVNGRNWINLALLAPGSRTAPAPVRETPRNLCRTETTTRRGSSSFHVDGQQVTSEFGTGGQPRYSQDAIAEFQFISNRFDATQGQSTGVQVNVITKSGTNLLSGLFRGNFRDSSFNSKNRVLDAVEPINNQQYSTAVGGPDGAGQAAFLRQLRIRARAEGQHLAHAVPVLQCLAGGDEQPEDRRRASRLSNLVARRA